CLHPAGREGNPDGVVHGYGSATYRYRRDDPSGHGMVTLTVEPDDHAYSTPARRQPHRVVHRTGTVRPPTARISGTMVVAREPLVRQARMALSRRLNAAVSHTHSLRSRRRNVPSPAANCRRSSPRWSPTRASCPAARLRAAECPGRPALPPGPLWRAPPETMAR